MSEFNGPWCPIVTCVVIFIPCSACIQAALMHTVCERAGSVRCMLTFIAAACGVLQPNLLLVLSTPELLGR
jgi:hypothetical protein